ncbi:carbohydrate sulfotransferase 11-like [Pecten maximus]|uniref:carbohydrate sulfotransferase 11-like n=1 Tax=Pecten maximus TaxID=6579 RepID=UPI0014585260|nr:carbohydrate sulfotransferase 11-like [Pecten maximus]XP_033746588.1 carbohydrate sulfotransferase 11-like [Pecten maximus]
MRRNKTALVLIGLGIGLSILVTILNKEGNTSTLQDASLSGSLLRDWSPQNKTEGKERITSTSAELENIERVQRLRQGCKLGHNRKTIGSQHLDYLIVDEKYKTVFCYIPKISCSQWKTIFITLSGKVNSSKLNFGNVHTKYQGVMKFLRMYSLKEQRQILNKYKKYIVVRNPLERLLSAYRNKLAGKGIHDYTFRKTGQEIVKRYRVNATRESLQNGDDVTFLEFVRYITDVKTRHFNDHWERYTKLCRPCLVKYDFVGKYETLNRDADYILKDIGVPPQIRFPRRSEKYSTVETKKTFETFYSQIPAEYIQKLWNVYRADFDLFGYSLSDHLNVTSIAEATLL